MSHYGGNKRVNSTISVSTISVSIISVSVEYLQFRTGRTYLQTEWYFHKGNNDSYDPNSIKIK